MDHVYRSSTSDDAHTLHLRLREPQTWHYSLRLYMTRMSMDMDLITVVYVR